MFNPAYTITPILLARIKQITSLIYELNQKRLPRVVLVELQNTAEAVSVYASTSIEGNPLPLTDVKRILKNRPTHLRESEQEVINCNTALIEVNDTLSHTPLTITTNLVLSIQKRVTHKLLASSQSGKFRGSPVFVNDPRLRKTVYWPPDHGDVPQLINDLLQYVKANTGVVDPLLLAGLFHKQMVIIHPFIDGNGRTTRLATKVLLAGMELNMFRLFSFENYYNQNVTRYFQEVGVRGNYYDIANQIDFTSWLEYFTEGIIDELLRVQKILPPLALRPQDELRLHHKMILTYLNKNPFITDSVYAGLTDRARATRRLDFNKLIELGLISKKDKGKNTFYILKKG